MPKFGNKSEEQTPKPAMDEIPAATKGAAASIPTSYVDNYISRSASSSGMSPEAQMLAVKQQAEIEKIIVESNLKKQEENWMKAYWRPAMGWLYMLICFCDFVAFPIISMFLPTIIKMQYVPWKSITLENGGLIHLAFGAILGITSWTRGQEKIAGKN